MTSTIFNFIADTAPAAKAVATTLTRGTTLLADGYEVRTYNKRNYRVESPEGTVYTVTLNDELGVRNCNCKAFENVGVCKHIIGVHLNRPTIDAEFDAREADHDAELAARAATMEDGETSQGCDPYAEL